MVPCPLCDSQLDIDEQELDEDDIIVCEECGSELRVVGLDPLELEEVEEEDEEEEDLDYDENGDEESWC